MFGRLKKLLDKWLKKKPPVVPPVEPPGPIDATEAERALIEAGKRIGVRSIVEGTTHDVLLREAREYARHMASINRQDGHAGFEGRAARIRQAIPGASPSEISAESWTLTRSPNSGMIAFNSLEAAAAFDAIELPKAAYSDEGSDQQVLASVAESMFNAWRSSPGHWEIANKPARYIGCSMAPGKGRWFACVIVVK